MSPKLPTQNPPVNYLHIAPVFMLMAAAVLVTVSNRHVAVVFASVCLGGVLVGPTVVAWSRRVRMVRRRKNTEERLADHTLAYLRRKEAAVPAVPAEPRAVKPAAFRDTGLVIARRPPAAEMVVFNTLPVPQPVACLPRLQLMPAKHWPEVAVQPDLAASKPGSPQPSIEYTPAVMDEIRMAAVEGFQRLRHGGVEVGGVLFGCRRSEVVQILASRPIACQYAEGPRFILSESDEAALAGMLATFREDPELRDMERVGWYHSHTRSDIHLSEQDVAFFNRFFPLRWQVALVIRPAVMTPSRAGFFYREPDGHIRTESSYREFDLMAGTRAAVAA